MLLTSLADEGYTSLTGTDYSEDAITLAQVRMQAHCCGLEGGHAPDTLWQELAVKEGHAHVQYHMADLMDPDSHRQRYDVVLDKGTYDAIKLGKPDDMVRRCDRALRCHVHCADIAVTGSGGRHGSVHRVCVPTAER